MDSVFGWQFFVALRSFTIFNGSINLAKTLIQPDHSPFQPHISTDGIMNLVKVRSNTFEYIMNMAAVTML